MVKIIFNNPFYQALFPYSNLNPIYSLQSNSSGFQPYQLSQSAIDNYLVNDNQESNGLESLVKSDDPLEMIIGSKKEVLNNTAKGVLKQIYERLAIKDQNLYEIDKRISRANSVLSQLDVFELGALPVIDKRKASFEKELILFEQEKRFEQVACWRDISRLKNQLLEVKAEIDNQSNRQRLIYG